MFSFSYIVSGLMIFVNKSEFIDMIEAYPIYFDVIYLCAFIYPISVIVPYYDRTNKIKRMLKERMQGVVLISWSDLEEQRINSVVDYEVAVAKKQIADPNRIILNSKLKKFKKSKKYHNDFYKEIFVVEGKIELTFDYNQREVINKGRKTIIREKEPHTIEALENSELVVTCVKL